MEPARSSSVPRGVKNNTVFVTKLNVDPVTNRASYADDCGVWNVQKSKATTTLYMHTGGRLVYVAKRNGVFCTGGRNGVWNMVSPQPDAADIVTIHRFYATLKGDDTYKKRVTWFVNLPKTA